MMITTVPGSSLNVCHRSERGSDVRVLPWHTRAMMYNPVHSLIALSVGLGSYLKLIIVSILLYYYVDVYFYTIGQLRWVGLRWIRGVCNLPDTE